MRHSAEGKRKAQTLLVILRDRLTALVAKGEMVPRYYNPGDLFPRVVVLLLNSDRPSAKDTQLLFGSAEVQFHNFTEPSFLRTLGFRPFLLDRWARQMLRFALSTQPDLIRCYGNSFNGYLGAYLGKKLGVPCVISLHGNPDIDYYRGRRATNLIKKLWGYAVEDLERLSVQRANLVLPVYSPIISYLKKHNVEHYKLIYNVVGYDRKTKETYEAKDSDFRLICVGRQTSLEKDPSPILRALVRLPTVSLVLIGNGDLHQSLIQLSKDLGISGRVEFCEALSNKEILASLATYDAYVYCSDNYEISKTCMEAALAGLPIILNDRGGNPADELRGGHFLLVEGTPQSYETAIRKIMGDPSFRKDLGTKGRGYAEKTWSPESMENQVRAVYSKLTTDGFH